MEPEDLLCWLEGFFALREAEGKPPQGLTARQAEVIKNHVKMVNITLDEREGEPRSKEDYDYGDPGFPLYPPGAKC